MTQIVQKSLPHAIAFADIGEPTMQKKVMMLVENIKALAAQLAQAQRAIIEMQRR